MIEKLKPCPFCGGEAKLSTYYDFYKAHCNSDNCLAEVSVGDVYNGVGKWYGSVAEAIAAWNTRADDVEELRKALEFERAENGWAREFLNRIGPKCGRSDCRSLVDYVEQLEANNTHAERTCEAKLCCDGFYRCTECNHVMLPSSNYCSNCGAKVVDE